MIFVDGLLFHDGICKCGKCIFSKVNRLPYRSLSNENPELVIARNYDWIMNEPHEEDDEKIEQIIMDSPYREKLLKYKKKFFDNPYPLLHQNAREFGFSKSEIEFDVTDPYITYKFKTSFYKGKTKVKHWIDIENIFGKKKKDNPDIEFNNAWFNRQFIYDTQHDIISYIDFKTQKYFSLPKVERDEQDYYLNCLPLTKELAEKTGCDIYRGDKVDKLKIDWL